MKRLVLTLAGSVAVLAGCAAETDASRPGDVGAVTADIENPQRSAAMYSEAVMVSVNNAEADFCTGVLVAPRVVLTASHCVSFNPDDDGAGPHGTWTIEAPFVTGGPQTVTASSGEPYDPAFLSLSVTSYDSNDRTLHDLGFIYLDQQITGFTTPSFSATAYTSGNVSAVGRKTVSAGAPLVLSAQVALSGPNASYPNDNHTPRITDGGDSGGPLFLEGTHTLVGNETRFDTTAKLDYWVRLDGGVYDVIQRMIGQHGGATNDPVFDFQEMAATALCARAAACCASGDAGYLASPTACRDIYLGYGFDATARDLLAASRGNVSVVAASRSSCLTAIGNTTACTVTSAAIKSELTSCVAAVTGSAGTGSACASSAECAGSAVCEHAADGSATCQPLHAAGASCEVLDKSGSVDDRYDLAQELCSKRGAATGDYCDAYDFVVDAYKTESTWTCKAAVANGGACGADSGCTSSVCAPVGAASALTCVASTPFVTSSVCSAFQ